MRKSKNSRFFAGLGVSIRYNPYDYFVTSVTNHDETTNKYSTVTLNDTILHGSSDDIVACSAYGGRPNVIEKDIGSSFNQLFVSIDAFPMSINTHQITRNLKYYMFDDSNVIQTKINKYETKLVRASHDGLLSYDYEIRNYIEVLLDASNTDDIMQFLMSEYVSVESCTGLYSFCDYFIDDYSEDYNLRYDQSIHCENAYKLYSWSCNPEVRLGVVQSFTVNNEMNNNKSVNVKIELLG